jgi:hypothetical protein
MQPFEARAGNVGEDGQGSAGGEGDHPACTKLLRRKVGDTRQTRGSVQPLTGWGQSPL